MPDFYYLRVGVTQLPREEGSEEIRRQQLEHFQTLKEQLLRCQRKRAETLIQARTDAQVRAVNAAEEAQTRLEEALADQARRLDAEALALGLGRPGRTAPQAGESPRPHL